MSLVIDKRTIHDYHNPVVERYQVIFLQPMRATLQNINTIISISKIEEH